MTSAAANFPPAAPPRAGVSSSKLHRPRQGLPLTGHWGVRGERADIKIRKVHLCPPGTIASIQTKSLKAEKTLVLSGGRSHRKDSGTVLCGWIRKLAGEHSILARTKHLERRSSSRRILLPVKGCGEQCSNRQGIPLVRATFRSRKYQPCVLGGGTHCPAPLLLVRVLIKKLLVTHNLEWWDGEGDGREIQEGGDIGVPMADSCCLTENHKFYNTIILQLNNLSGK